MTLTGSDTAVVGLEEAPSSFEVVTDFASLFDDVVVEAEPVARGLRASLEVLSEEKSLITTQRCIV